MRYLNSLAEALHYKCFKTDLFWKVLYISQKNTRNRVNFNIVTDVNISKELLHKSYLAVRSLYNIFLKEQFFKFNLSVFKRHLYFPKFRSFPPQSLLYTKLFISASLTCLQFCFNKTFCIFQGTYLQTSIIQPSVACYLKKSVYLQTLMPRGRGEGDLVNTWS